MEAGRLCLGDPAGWGKLIIIRDSASLATGAIAGGSERIYLEPFGLKCLISHSNQPIGFNLFQMWIDRWNGRVLDKEEIFGKVKGLKEAFTVGD